MKEKKQPSHDVPPPPSVLSIVMPTDCAWRMSYGSVTKGGGSVCLPSGG
jgi:hypothetical protein